MKKAILATKVGMTQIFNEDGQLIPVTVLQAGPCVVTQVKTCLLYTSALNLCREGHEDMAAIRLKKILIQNPKLIKGYHLLALVQMKGW